MKLEITKEKVLEAASKCETAKQTLKVLFPEAFVEKDELICDTRNGCAALVYSDGRYLLSQANDRSKGIHLSCDFDWKIEYGYLIPTKK